MPLSVPSEAVLSPRRGGAHSHLCARAEDGEVDTPFAEACAMQHIAPGLDEVRADVARIRHRVFLSQVHDEIIQ